MVTKTKEEIVAELFEQGILVTPEMLAQDVDSLNNLLNQEMKTQSSSVLVSSESGLDKFERDLEQQLDNSSTYDPDYLDSQQKCFIEKNERNDDLYQNQLQNQFQHHLQSHTQTPTQDSLLSQPSDSSKIELNLSEDKKEEDFLLKQLESQMDINKEESTKVGISVSEIIYPLNIIISYENIPRKYETKDFTNIFVTRYKFIEKVLRNRTELTETLTTIARLLTKKEKETVSIIGMIKDINTTKNNNMLVTIEDLTGQITVLFSKNKPDLFTAAKDLIEDEVIGISGMSGDKIIFADKLIWPDIPSNGELKLGPEDISAIFLSDIHVGSKMFLKEEFGRFLAWIRGEYGSEEQKEAARKVKYIFIAGDLVDGVGIYPSQEEELEIKEITQQYAEFSRLISQIPLDKQIIVCPGNHDLVHLAEPQPIFYKQYAPSLFNVPNLTLVTNPSIINIGKTADFSGFDVLMYHGYSFDHYIANVESIRSAGGYHRADLIMKYLLKRRHLAPSFASTPYFPAHAEDPLLIKKIPDFFLSGHIHYSKVSLYKGVTLISGSCWQGKTSFQEKLGHEPEPARVPLVNLKTREVKVLKFI